MAGQVHARSPSPSPAERAAKRQKTMQWIETEATSEQKAILYDVPRRDAAGEGADDRNPLVVVAAAGEPLRGVKTHELKEPWRYMHTHAVFT
jgi:hypothetical protein